IENRFEPTTSRWLARWWRLSEDGGDTSPGQLVGETEIRLYSAHELRAMLRPERWSQVDVYGALDGTPFSLDTPRLVFSARKSRRPSKGDACMSADSRPLVVVSAPLHKDAVAMLERECRVIITDDPTEEGMIKTAAEAQGILFRGRPRSSASLMEACKRLKVV